MHCNTSGFGFVPTCNPGTRAYPPACQSVKCIQPHWYRCYRVRNDLKTPRDWPRSARGPESRNTGMCVYTWVTFASGCKAASWGLLRPCDLSSFVRKNLTTPCDWPTSLSPFCDWCTEQIGRVMVVSKCAISMTEILLSGCNGLS